MSFRFIAPLSRHTREEREELREKVKEKPDVEEPVGINLERLEKIRGLKEDGWNFSRRTSKNRVYLRARRWEDGKRKKAVEYRKRRMKEVAEKAKKGEADDLDLRVANALSLLNRDVKAGRRKEERIIQPYQFHDVVRKYLEENPWMTRYIEETIQDLRDREKEKARQELLKYYEDYGKDWINDYIRHHPYKLEEAGFESFDAFVEWAESKKD